LSGAAGRTEEHGQILLQTFFCILCMIACF